MESKVVLVPLDGSAVAEAALSYAEAIATATGASLRLLTATSTLPDDLLSRLNGGDAYLEVAKRQATEHLDTVAATLRGRGRTVSTHVADGEAVDAILSAARAADVSMVVMATHGLGGVTRWLIGSVADKVVRLGTRPTLLVRPAEGAEQKPEIRLQRLLVPLDGSTLAEAALGPAVELALATGARLSLVQVQPWLYTSFPSDAFIPDMGNWDDEVVASSYGYLVHVKDRLPLSITIDTRVLRGTPRHILDEYIHSQQIDLVIMSTHGRGGFRRFVLGSTADWLIRAGVPTLLTRPFVSGAAPEKDGAEPAMAGSAH